MAVKKDVDQLAALQRRAKSEQRDFRVYLDRMDDRELCKDDLLSMGDYHECYGVWFSGGLWQALKEVVQDNCRIVYCNVPPGKITEGIHNVYCGGRSAKLYFWFAQGYPRGMVVWEDDETANAVAARLLDEKPWNWQWCFI
ncbi:hypothetical protein FY034_17775 (plasmid) [Trichlorobacter lovleyi]|nr:hypothetical protein FY034_17775 [Trichlorobacter lovleyi]